jgi:glutamate synthase domain-containing protein 2
MTYRTIFIILASILTVLLTTVIIYSPDQRVLAIGLLLFLCVGWYDVVQPYDNILRDYPIVGHMRYILRGIAPELQQYFIETNTSGEPFNKNTIQLIKSRGENKEIYHPFGTEQNFYKEGLAWVSHSLFPAKKLEVFPREDIGGPNCKQIYSASILNISAMSFGSLSENAIIALNEGAEHGNFYHNTGEGGLTPYHEKGGDIVLQIGTGNFGFRHENGRFHDDLFREKSNRSKVKMIEIKISQGAKPGHGGVLPAVKNTEEIAKIRVVEPGVDVLSPPVNPEITSLEGIGDFVVRVRKLSNYKPVGIKLCIGSIQETEELIDMFVSQNSLPDFITIDASEGGTGAAPIEYSNHVGMRGDDALRYMDSLLKEKGVREQTKLIYGGKVCTGFTMFKAFCYGADVCNSARGFMFSLGCIQALRCHTDSCPTGVATQNKKLQEGLVPKVKRVRVYRYHKNTIHSFLEIMATAGIRSKKDLHPGLVNQTKPTVFGI